MIKSSTIYTPLGDMKALVRNDELCLLEFLKPERIKLQEVRLLKFYDEKIEPDDDPLFAEIQHQLDKYFNGKLQTFDLPLNIHANVFRHATWEFLLQISYGQTRTYMDLALMHGDAKKVRAIGKANGANRIAIIVPCHRVIGADGSLVGYAGELWRKKHLLDLEAEHSGRGLQLEIPF